MCSSHLLILLTWYVPTHLVYSDVWCVLLQGEDEAMARAIAASLSHSTPPSSVSHSPEQAPVVMGDDDEALAHAIAASLQDSQPRTAPVSSS